MRPIARLFLSAACVVLLAMTLPAANAALLGWWPFEGNLDDQSGNGLNGVYYQGGTVGGTPVYGTRPGGGQALQMDGADDNMRANFSPAFTPTRFTLSWFVNPNTARNWSEQITVDNNWNKFVFHTTQNWEVYTGVVNSSNWNSRFTPTQLPAGTLSQGTWQHFAFTFDNGNAAFYKDGSMVASKTGMDMPSQWNTMFVGNPGSDTIDGLVDDVAVWNSVISPLDIPRLASGDATPATVSATELVSYRIQVGAPTDNASVSGYVTDDLEVQGPQFLSASSGAGSNVVTATGTLAWRLGVTDFLQLEVNASGAGVWDQAPYVAATFTAPRGYVWEETGNQYLWTRSGPTGVPTGEPIWFASSQRWGDPLYIHGDYDPEQGFYASNVIEISPPGPTPPLGPGFSPGTKAVWGMGAGGEFLQPSFLDTQGTLVPGIWNVAGTPLGSLPGGSGPGISTVVIRTNNAINNLTDAGTALTLLPGNANYNMGQATTLAVTQVDGLAGSGAGYTPSVYLAGSASGQTGQPENYALSMKGYVYIPNWDTDPVKEGTQLEYSFSLGSNDGARLKIGETIAYEELGTVSGAMSHVSTPLGFYDQDGNPRPGYWPIEVTWFQDGAEGPTSPNLGLVVSVARGINLTWNATDFLRLGDTVSGGWGSGDPEGAGLLIYTSELPPPTLGSPLTSGPPVFAGALDTQQTPGDGLRVQQAPIASVTSVDRVRSFFADKIIHNDPTKNLFDSPSPGVVRRYMDMVDPENAANGNFGVNEAFPNNTAADDNSFGTRINGLFYAQSAGTYSFTVSSDDSFWLRVGTQTLGTLGGARTDMPTGTANQMYVNLPAAGLYPIEFYSHAATGAAGIEIAHGAETALLVTTRNPNGQNGGATTVDWGGAGYSVTPVARLQANSVALEAQAYGAVPALAGVPLSDGKPGVVAPEYWKLEQVLGQTITIRTPDPNNAGQYVTGFRGRWYQPVGTYPAGPPAFDSDITGFYYNQVSRATGQYPGTTWPDGVQPGGTDPTHEDDFIASYTGQLYIPKAGNYIFAEHVDDNAWIYIDGVQRLYNTQWNVFTQVSVPLTQGWHDIELRTQEGGGGDYAYFYWDFGTGSLPLSAMSGGPTAGELATMDPYLLRADYLQEELLLLAEGTGAIGDLLGYETMMVFPMDWHQQYALRLTTDIAGLRAVYEGTFKFLPEPTTLVLLAGGLLAVARRRRKRRS